MVEGDFESMPDAKAWAVLNRAIKRAAEERGYRLSRVPGRGRSNMWRVERDGQVQKASFRTTKDRWIALRVGRLHDATAQPGDLVQER